MGQLLGHDSWWETEEFLQKHQCFHHYDDQDLEEEMNLPGELFKEGYILKAAVADTSVISYLVLIDAISLLPLLFDRILIPQAVSQELNHPK